MRPRCLLPRTAGFSLIEMIAAILLLALAFTALLQVIGSSMRLSSQAAQYSEAAMWARSLLGSVDVGVPLRAGSSDGRFDNRYRWHLQISPMSMPSNASNVSNTPTTLQLYKLDLHVLWGPAAHAYSAHFATLRLASKIANSSMP